VFLNILIDSFCGHNRDDHVHGSYFFNFIIFSLNFFLLLFVLLQ